MLDVDQYAVQIASQLNIPQSLARTAQRSTPEWLTAVWQVLCAGGGDSALSLFREFARAAEEFGEFSQLGAHRGDPDLALSVGLYEQLQLVLETLKGIFLGNGVPQAAHGQDASFARMQVELLRETAATRPQSSVTEPDWHLSGNAQKVQMPVLLVFEGEHGAQQGCVARLQLQLWHRPGAHLCFLPSPAQMCTPTTQRFAQSLETVSLWLRSTLPAYAGCDWAVVWDLIPQKGAYHLLAGASASAAFALGSLWLLRQHCSGAWQQALLRLSAADLKTLYISAELLHSGQLAPIGGLMAKNQSLALTRAALGGSFGNGLPLHAAQEQADITLVGDHQPLLIDRHPTLLSVVQAAVARPMSVAQQGLYQALYGALATLADQPKPAHHPYPIHEPPSLPKEAGRWLSLLTMPDSQTRSAVSDLAHYALHRWASRGKSSGSGMVGCDGQVHQRFVNLRVKWPWRAGQPESFPSLEHLMAACDPGQNAEDDAPKNAYLVVGEPGSGKTWLMARHEQALAEQFLWQDMQGSGTGTDNLPVLPLYLPLNLLPSDADPVTYFRDWLAREYPDHRLGLTQRLDPQARQRSGTAPAFRLRLMLDGLNEVKTRDGVEQDVRAKAVVISLWQAFTPELPMVLGIRPGRDWLLDDPGIGFNVGIVSLDRWKRTDIEKYLERRWCQGDSRVQTLVQALPPESAHEALLGVPLYLNIQCELVEAGASQLLANRAHLLAAMLWLRLGQELARLGAVAMPGMVSPSEKRTALAFARQPGRPPEFARDGWLLRGLFAQAKAQWLAEPGTDAQARGQVSVPVYQVEHNLKAAGLPQDVWETWFEAVSDLGVGQRNLSSMQFRFEHQVFGEWLASQQLFYSGATTRGASEPPLPSHWSPAALVQLAQELAPPPLARKADDELEHQRAEAAKAWADPRLDELFRSFLKDGLSLPLAQLKDRLEEARSIAFGDINILERYQSDDLGFLRIDTASGSGTWRYGSFGQVLVDRQVLPGINRLNDWRNLSLARAGVFTHTITWPEFAKAAQVAVAEIVGHARMRELWAHGRLGAPVPGLLDDVVPLAFDALDDPLPWLEWMLGSTRKALANFSGSAGCTFPLLGATGAWALLSRCLVHLRERLSRHAETERVRSLWVGSAQCLLSVAQDAFAQHEGHDPRQRMQAGELLGLQGSLGSERGDSIRFEQAGRGVRLKPEQWSQVGGVGQCFRLGDVECGTDAASYVWLGDHQDDMHPLSVFRIACFPVTVGEYLCFVEAGGYGGDGEALPPWWQAAGPRAVRWLHGRQSQSADVRPTNWERDGWTNPLQPVTGVTWFEALAYVCWAQDHVYADWAQHEGGHLALPTEWQWEAAMRGPHLGPFDAEPLRWPGDKGTGRAAPMLFNHVSTGLGRPSAVGCWGGSCSPLGLFDGVGNTWDWCSNVYAPDGASATNGQAVTACEVQGLQLRALRGGSYDSTAAKCRVGVRGCNAPDYPLNDSGFRLVWVVTE